MIALLHEQESFSVSSLCDALGVARSSYYAGRAESEAAAADREFGDEVARVFREHRARYGSRRIAQEFARRPGDSPGRHRVRRIMAKRGLKALKTPRKFLPRTSDGGAPAPAPNLLLNREEPAAVDQVWVADITCIPVAGAPWVYLAMVMDFFSRRIVGWRVEDRPRPPRRASRRRARLRHRQPQPGPRAHCAQRTATRAASTSAPRTAGG